MDLVIKKYGNEVVSPKNLSWMGEEISARFGQVGIFARATVTFTPPATVEISFQKV